MGRVNVETAARYLVLQVFFKVSCTCGRFSTCGLSFLVNCGGLPGATNPSGLQSFHIFHATIPLPLHCLGRPACFRQQEHDVTQPGLPSSAEGGPQGGNL